MNIKNFQELSLAVSKMNNIKDYDTPIKKFVIEYLERKFPGGQYLSKPIPLDEAIRILKDEKTSHSDLKRET